MYPKRFWSLAASLLLTAFLLGVGLFCLTYRPVKADPAATFAVEFGVMKKPGMTTQFWVTNTGAAPAMVLHSYFRFEDPIHPIYTETHPLAPGAGAFYDVGAVPGLPAIFYGQLRLTSPQPMQMRIETPRKRIEGQVVYLGTTRPVTDARIIAQRVGTPDVIEARTHISTGQYILNVDGGRWLLSVAPLRGHPQTEWIFADAPVEVEFDRPPEQPEVRLARLRVISATGHLLGHIHPMTVPTRIIARTPQGLSNEAVTFPNGDFILQVPVGMYDLYVRPQDIHWGGFNFNGILITETTHVPPVNLRPANAVITGQVTDAAGHTLIGVMRPARVIAWERQGPGWGMVETGPDGHYVLPLVAGPQPTEWVVRVEPPPTAPGAPPYVPELPKEVVLRQGARREVNFRLLPADGKIIGQAVAPDGADLTVSGRVHTLRHPDDRWPRLFDAPMYQGAFTLTVPTTHTYNMVYDVAVRPDPASPFAPGYLRGVDPPTSGQTFVTVTLQPRNALIVGALVDARVFPTVTRVITGVPAQVFAANRPPDALEGDWQMRWVNPETGGYRLGVFSDTWRLDFRTEWRPGVEQPFPWAPHPRFRHDPALYLQTVAAHEVITVPLPVIPLDRWITGTVRLEVPGVPLPRPLPYVQVCAEGIDAFNRGMRHCVETNPQGGYLLHTTPGHYRVNVLLPQNFRERGYLPPDAEIANAPEGAVNFTVRRANATVRGPALISTTAVLTQPRLLVWGWSLNGSHVQQEVFLPETAPGSGVFSPTARYAISVTGTPSGTTWYFGAAYRSGGVIYRAPRQRVVVLKGGVVELALRLASVQDLLGRLPAPRSVTFDRSLGVSIALDNGALLQIPAGAIPADTDDVTIDLYPLALTPEQRFEEVVGFGYTIAAYDADGNQIVAQFLDNVALTLPYDPALLPPGVAEEDILPAYLSTTSGRWEAPESYSVDMAADTVTLYINHFTDFALTAEPTLAGPAAYPIYLPLVLRSTP